MRGHCEDEIAAAYARGLAAGRAEALEQAAGVCDERAAKHHNSDTDGNKQFTSFYALELEASQCADDIRALAAAPAGDA